MSRHLGIAKEVTYGLALTPTHYMEALSEDLHVEREQESLATIRSFVPIDIFELTQVVKGSFEMLANYEEIGILLRAFLGNVDRTGAGPIYTHTYPKSTGLADRTDSFCVEVLRDTGASNSFRYSGLKCQSWNVSSANDRTTRMTFGWLGKTGAVAGPGTPTFPTFRPIPPADVSLTMDPDPPGGPAALNARTFDLTCEWPTDETFQLGSSSLSTEPIDNLLVVTGSSEIHFVGGDADDMIAAFLGFTTTDVAVAMTDGTHSLTINMNNTKLTKAEPGVSGRDRLVATYEWEAFFDTTATGSLQAILVDNDDETDW